MSKLEYNSAHWISSLDGRKNFFFNTKENVRLLKKNFRPILKFKIDISDLGLSGLSMVKKQKVT
jgi:hypothetical protein